MVAWLKPITLRDSRGGSWLRYPDRRDRDPLPQPLSGPGRPRRPAPVPAHRADSHTTPRRTTRRNVPSTGNFKNPRIPISIEQLNVVTPGELRPGPCVDLTCGRSRTPARRGTRTPDPSPWPCVPRPRSRPPHGGRPRSARRHLPVEEQDAAPVLAPRPTLGCLLPFAPSIRHGARMTGVAALHHRHVPQRARAGEAAPRGAPPRTKGPAGAGAQVRRSDARRRGQTPGGRPVSAALRARQRCRARGPASCCAPPGDGFAQTFQQAFQLRLPVLDPSESLLHSRRVGPVGILHPRRVGPVGILHPVHAAIEPRFEASHCAPAEPDDRDDDREAGPDDRSDDAEDADIHTGRVAASTRPAPIGALVEACARWGFRRACLSRTLLGTASRERRVFQTRRSR